ncbi:MAG: CAP domain-containing protein, partial [Clostridia bacterium]|nr:CAP domain-containing protein [Clostridia bacterium]
NSWMNSPGHRANILNRSFTEIGVGAAKKSNGTLYWTQLFLKPL